MGPAAGLILHRQILDNTKAGGDQEHLKVIHMSLSDMIADRTSSLLEGRPEVPGAGMAAVIAAAAASCDALGLGGIAGIPCNTFHAEPIWSAFTERLSEIVADRRPPKLINMIEETIGIISSECTRGSRIGIISTTGTRLQKIYSHPLADAGFVLIEPDEQDEVHQLIYAPDWGLKASFRVSSKASEVFHTQINKLVKRGAERIILGCTELPLAINNNDKPDIELIDPMNVLARALVKAVDPDKLK